MKIGRRPKLNDRQQAEVRKLISESRADGGYITYAELGPVFGVSESTIARIVGSSGKIGAPVRRRGPCAVCRIEYGHGRKIIRFQLTLHLPRSRSSKGAGSIDLCERCWGQHAKNQRPWRQKRSTLVMGRS